MPARPATSGGSGGSPASSSGGRPPVATAPRPPRSAARPPVPALNMSRVSSHALPAGGANQTAPARRYSVCSDAGSVGGGGMRSPDPAPTPPSASAEARYLERLRRAKELRASPQTGNFDRLHAAMNMGSARRSVSRAGKENEGGLRSSMSGLPPLSRAASPAPARPRSGASSGSSGGAPLRTSNASVRSSAQRASDAKPFPSPMPRTSMDMTALRGMAASVAASSMRTPAARPGSAPRAMTATPASAGGITRSLSSASLSSRAGARR
jgi:hypothetical protein